MRASIQAFAFCLHRPVLTAEAAVSANVAPASPGVRGESGRSRVFKPSQEQIVLLITILLLLVFARRCRALPASPTC